MDWFISDTHFGHRSLLKTERSEFNNTEEHDDYIVETINKYVKPTDRLYILGDVGNFETLKRLNGYKILIQGNHDNVTNKYAKQYVDEYYKNPIYYNRKVMLSHYPHPVPPHILNVHGHLHGAILDSKNHFNVSAAMIEYKPVNEKDLLTIVNTLPKERNDFLYEWYADKYKFADTRKACNIIADENGLVKLKESRRKLAKDKAKKNKH